MILFVRGSVIIGSSGSIQSNGSTGGSGHPTVAGNYPYSQSGAGSGGGAIHMFYKGDITNVAKITASGGAAGSNTANICSGSGGSGTVNIVKL